MIVLDQIFERFQREDYLYSRVFDSQVESHALVTFYFAIKGLSVNNDGNESVDVSLFCSENGIEWVPMNDSTKSYSYSEFINGVFSTIVVDFSTEERFKKFGFNVNGTPVDVLLLGVVTE